MLVIIKWTLKYWRFSFCIPGGPITVCLVPFHKWIWVILWELNKLAKYNHRHQLELFSLVNVFIVQLYISLVLRYSPSTSILTLYWVPVACWLNLVQTTHIRFRLLLDQQPLCVTVGTSRKCICYWRYSYHTHVLYTLCLSLGYCCTKGQGQNIFGQERRLWLWWVGVTQVIILYKYKTLV